MNKLLVKMKDVSRRIDNKALRLIITLISLVLFVLAAGAPGTLGGIGM